MARKNKKKKVKNNKQRAQRQQKKQQRRAKRTGEYTSANQQSAHDELFDDVESLFASARGPNGVNSEMAMENLFFTAADTAHLIDEPEFDDVGFDPVMTPTLFVEASAKLGFDDVDNIDEDKQYDVIVDITEEIIEDLLAGGVREEIIEAVDSLRIRLKNSRQRRQDVTRLAALRMVLTSDEDDDTKTAWPAMGLVQALLQRSMGSGLDLMEVLDELPEDPDEVANLLEKHEAASRPDTDSPLQKLADLVEKSPFLARFVSKQYDEIIGEGLDALSEGQLVLDVFLEKERAVALSIFYSTQFEAYKQLGLTLDLEDLSEPTEEKDREIDRFLSSLDKDKAVELTTEAFVPRFHALIEEIFSEETRLKKLAAQLDRSAAAHVKADSEWAPFLIQTVELLAESLDDVIDEGILLHALMGEIKPELVLNSEKDAAISAAAS